MLPFALALMIAPPEADLTAQIAAADARLFHLFFEACDPAAMATIRPKIWTMPSTISSARVYGRCSRLHHEYVAVGSCTGSSPWPDCRPGI